MQQNKACASLVTKGFPTVPSMSQRDIWSKTCHHDKQNKHHVLIVGLIKIKIRSLPTELSAQYTSQDHTNTYA